MRYRRVVFLIAGLLLLAAVPTSAVAQVDLFPIVPCGTQNTPGCTPCGFLDLLENVVKFITFGMAGPIAAALFVYVGLRFLLSAGNPQRILQAKTVLTNTIYGVTIILVAWLVVVQLIKTIAPGSEADSWYEFSCPEFLRGAGIVDALAPSGPAKPGAIAGLPEPVTCKEENFADLANQYGTNPDKGAIAQSLTELVGCLSGDAIVAKIMDPQQLFILDSKGVCQIVRGKGVCGSGCHHSKNSCHYGGSRGSDGAEAVDFNIKKSTGSNGQNVPATETCPAGFFCGTRESGVPYQIAAGDEVALFNELRRVAEEKSCAFKYLNFEENHTHVSSVTCDADGRSQGRINPPE